MQISVSGKPIPCEYQGTVSFVGVKCYTCTFNYVGEIGAPNPLVVQGLAVTAAQRVP